MARKKRKGPNVGVSITDTHLEIAVFNPKGFQIERSHQVPLPEGVMGENGDRVLDINQLASVIKSSIGEMKPKVKAVNLSVTATLLRMVEMPKMEPKELYLSLSSEAERYKSFDDTEAIVDFHILPPIEGLAPNMNRVVFGAIRSDAFAKIQGAFKAARIKIASVDIQPLNILRAMAGTGVLDSLVEQIGADNYWGTIFVEPERVRFSLWRGSELIDLREVSMDTTEFATADADAPYIFDLVDEIRRTTKSAIPAVWLTQDLPDNMIQGLAEQLGVPVRPCMMGSNLKVERPEITLASIGAAMHSQIEFPFDFNFVTGAAESAVMGKKGATAEVVEYEEEGPGPTILIATGVIMTTLCLLVWGGMAIFNTFMLADQVAKLEQEQNAKVARISQLQAEVKRLELETDLRALIVDIIEKAQTRNIIYLKLAEDLQTLTPTKVWIFNVEVGDIMRIEGKALSHQAVIDFARQFDSLLYARDIIIESIQEEAGPGSILYKFSIGGRPNLDPDLLPKPVEEPKEEDEASENPDKEAAVPNEDLNKDMDKKAEAVELELPEEGDE